VTTAIRTDDLLFAAGQLALLGGYWRYLEWRDGRARQDRQARAMREAGEREAARTSS